MSDTDQERELMAAICDAYEKRYPRDQNPMLDPKFHAGYEAALAVRDQTRAKIEQEVENDQGQRMQRTGRCPVCGAEQEDDGR